MDAQRYMLLIYREKKSYKIDSDSRMLMNKIMS